jgi:rare lipoprotein A (peptidoglycan hydrolase)
MSLRRTVLLSLAMAMVATLIGSHTAPAFAAPSAGDVAADRAALDRALARYETARAAAAEIDERLEAASAQLDDAVVREAESQAQLQARVASMYRAGDDGTLALLLGARDIQDLAERLDMIQRLARADATTIQDLKTARAAAERTSGELLTLQAEQARALDALASEVTAARAEFAASQTALAEYEAKLAAEKAAAAKAAAARVAGKAKQPPQTLTGSGEWKTAVASHYSRTFTGRGASGEEIGPYSMIVAHKTLPFGTLIEFEYKGKRAVARVADRGPYTPGRTFDLGPGVVRVLDFNGVHEVRYRIVSR